MSKEIGRNDPCWCESGKKYKRCCLPLDEANAREAARQEELYGPGFDEFDADGQLDGLDDDYGVDEEDFAFDGDTITRICYTRGVVDTIADLRAGRRLCITEWEAPAIPPMLLDLVEEEGLAFLAGRWGDTRAGEPIQVDIIDLESETGVISIEVFNRGSDQFDMDSDAIRGVLRACTRLDAIVREMRHEDAGASEGRETLEHRGPGAGRIGLAQDREV